MEQLLSGFEHLSKEHANNHLSCPARIRGDVHVKSGRCCGENQVTSNNVPVTMFSSSLLVHVKGLGGDKICGAE